MSLTPDPNSTLFPPDDVNDVNEITTKDFWKARTVLSHVHDYARARRVGPWAVLGCVLARVVAATTPAVQIPPTIGGNASLNLFVGLVGNSGSGKDSARKVAAECVEIRDPAFNTNPLGSGEGLSHMFMRPATKEEQKEGHDLVQYNTAALVTIGEIDTLSALVTRSSSTVASQLRQAAMGEQLGFFYVDTAKRMLVPEHSYRLCLVAGIQPARSEVLLGDVDGGTPQRFLWLPAGDPDAPDLAPVAPQPLAWVRPDIQQAGRSARVGAREVRLPQVVIDTTNQIWLDRTREKGDDLAGHANLTRTKVASALAILDGRYEVTDDDWDLSATLMAVSDGARQRCQKALSGTRAKENKIKAIAESERIEVIRERADEAALKRATSRIKRVLADRGLTTRGLLRNALRAEIRPYFDEAVEMLMISDVVTVIDDKYELRQP